MQNFEEDENINITTPNKPSQISVNKNSEPPNEINKTNQMYNNISTPISMKSQPSLQEQQAASLAFSQMLSNNSKNQALPMDKEKLFETFLLFQNFINMNQNSNTHPSNMQSPINDNSTYEGKENIVHNLNSHFQEKINQVELHEENQDNHKEHNDSNNNNLCNSTERFKTESNVNENNNNNNNINNNIDSPNRQNNEIESHEKKEGEKTETTQVKITNNYDDIQIKPANVNFMELVEKSLANDANNYTNNPTNSTTKKKIIKPSYHQKRILNISKPSKNDKKYSYYTDLLDENGRLNEKKITKTSQKTTDHNLLSPQSSCGRSDIKYKILDNANNKPIYKKTKTSTSQFNQSDQEDKEYKEEKEEKNEKDEKEEKVETEAQKEEEGEDHQHINNIISDINVNNNIDIEPKESQLCAPIQINNITSNSRDTSTLSIKEQKIDQQIKQLNIEIVKFKEERQKVFRLKNEYEKLHYKLQEDLNSFNLRKKEFETYRENEIKKLQKEKKNMMQEIKSFNNLKVQNQNLTMNAKRDKEQIENLKNQILKIQNENKQKEINNKLMIDKLKKQLEDAKKENNLTNYDYNHLNIATGLAPQINSNQGRGRSTTQFQKIPKSKTTNKFSQKNLPQSKNIESELKDNGINDKQLKPSQTPLSTKNFSKNNTLSTNTFSKVHPKTNTNTNSNTNIIPTTNNIKHKSSSISPTSPQNVKAKPKIVTANTNSNSTNNINPTANFNIKQINSLGNPIKSPNINFDFSSENYDFVLPDKYADTNPNSHEPQYTLLKSVTTSEGKKINLYTNNKREVIFQSGVRKEIYDDGYQIVYFMNGDLKQIFPNGKSVYYFNEAKTVQTTFQDGLQVFKFNNGQIEKHYPDGTKQISFPDGSLRYILNDGYEETHYADGAIQKIDKNNVVTTEHIDGTKEIKYPDGREEIIYPDGQVKEVQQEGEEGLQNEGGESYEDVDVIEEV